MGGNLVRDRPMQSVSARARLRMLGLASLFIALAACAPAPSLEHDPRDPASAMLEALTGVESTVREVRFPDPGVLPADHDGAGYHLQGVQALPGGGLVLSGSAAESSYFFVADSEGRVRHLERLDEVRAHAGGFQIDGGLLAVGIERQGERDGGSEVRVFDVSDAFAPRALPHLTIRRAALTAGAVGIASDARGALLVVGSWDSEQLDFHRLEGEPSDPRARWSDPISWRADREGLAPGSIGRDWPPYQGVFLVGLADGALGLVGLYSGVPFVGHDHADFHWLTFGQDGRPEIVRFARLALPQEEGRRFQSAGGLVVHASPPVLELIACDHQIDHDVVRCTAWR